MSVISFREVLLDIVRPGKQHNQLLSPLTPYMALCGRGSPITFTIDFEHQQLLNRLKLLRYVNESGDRAASIPRDLREAEVQALGNNTGEIFSKIGTLSTELNRAKNEGAADAVVHLRIVLSGSELSLIPFEMGIAPVAYPGEGLEFCLQKALPVVLTREIRRGRPLDVNWNQSPKMLVIFAEPDGMRVPATEHVQTIRNSLEPWIRRIRKPDLTTDQEPNNRKRLELVKNRLRVLPNASIDDISAACAEEQFTHVHILAHGDAYQEAGVRRFGVALCKKGSMQKEVVSGKRLAKALQVEGERGSGRSAPLVVTLATCDSGSPADVLAPGGSIAHDLHVEDRGSLRRSFRSPSEDRYEWQRCFIRGCFAATTRGRSCSSFGGSFTRARKPITIGPAS